MKRKKTDEAMTAQLEHGKILPLIFRLAVPAIIAQLITFLYNIVDRMYVARIEGVGTEALAALGIVLPITLIIQALSSLIGIGGSPRAGIKLGEGNDGEANIIFNNAFVLLVTVGVITEVLTAIFAKPLVVLFGCPPTAVEYASSYLRIYAYGTVFADPILLALHEGQWLGADHQSKFYPRSSGVPLQKLLCYGKARPFRHDKNGGIGGRRVWDHRQLHLSVVCDDPAGRGADCRAGADAQRSAASGHFGHHAGQGRREENASAGNGGGDLCVSLQ